MYACEHMHVFPTTSSLVELGSICQVEKEQLVCSVLVHSKGL